MIATADGRSAQLAIDSIDFHPRNVRVELGDLRDLAASIAEVGVLEPLIVEDRGPRARVLAGHRRLAASRLAGLRRVPCVVVAPHDDDEAIAKMVSENHHRLGLTPAEKTQAARQLRGEFGWTQARIARRFGVHEQTIGRWLNGAAAEEQPTAKRGESTPAYRPNAEPAPKPPRVPGLDLHDVVNRWQHTAPPALLAELRGLLGGWTP